MKDDTAVGIAARRLKGGDVLGALRLIIAQAGAGERQDAPKKACNKWTGQPHYGHYYRTFGGRARFFCPGQVIQP